MFQVFISEEKVPKILIWVLKREYFLDFIALCGSKCNIWGFWTIGSGWFPNFLSIFEAT